MGIGDLTFDDIRRLRALGVTHYKAADFEVTLGYPFGEAPKVQSREGGRGTPASPNVDAADLVLYPPDLAKVVEDR